MAPVLKLGFGPSIDQPPSVAGAVAALVRPAVAHARPSFSYSRHCVLPPSGELRGWNGGGGRGWVRWWACCFTGQPVAQEVPCPVGVRVRRPGHREPTYSLPACLPRAGSGRKDALEHRRVLGCKTVHACSDRPHRCPRVSSAKLDCEPQRHKSPGDQHQIKARR